MTTRAVANSEAKVPAASTLAFANDPVAVNENFAALIFRFADDDLSASRSVHPRSNFDNTAGHQLPAGIRLWMGRAEFSIRDLHGQNLSPSKDLRVQIKNCLTLKSQPIRDRSQSGLGAFQTLRQLAR